MRELAFAAALYATFDARSPGFAKLQKLRKGCSTAKNLPGKTLSKHVQEFLYRDVPF